jgi:hypothetical protein
MRQEIQSLFPNLFALQTHEETAASIHFQDHQISCEEGAA